MIRAHKIRLYPNNKQETYFRKACGVSRFAYNWGLNKWKEMYESGEKPNAIIISKELNKIKKEQFPWMKEVTKCASEEAIVCNLKNAFNNFYRKNCKYPKFKKKGIHDTFSFSNVGGFSVKNNYVRIPKLGLVKMSQSLRYHGRIIQSVVSRKADKWYISISVEVPDVEKIHPKSENQAVGVDLGVKALATLSDGTVIDGRQVTKEFSRKVRHLQKELSRRKGAKKGEKKSNNFKKTQMKLAKVYVKMVNIRQDHLHKLTHFLTQNYGVIGIEDLNVSGMVKNHRLAGAIQDRGFYEFRRQLGYKAEETKSITASLYRSIK